MSLTEKGFADRAADEERSARLKIQGPSGKGWTASITPASAASLRVFDATFRTRAASPRLSHGSASATRLPADAHADAVGAEGRRGLSLTIGVGAAVDGVLDHPVDGRVVGSSPGEIAIDPLHRQIETMLLEPKQGLPRAAQFLDLVEHQRYCVLDATVRILLVPITSLHEADGHGDDQFPAPAFS